MKQKQVSRLGLYLFGAGFFTAFFSGLIYSGKGTTILVGLGLVAGFTLIFLGLGAGLVSITMRVEEEK